MMRSKNHVYGVGHKNGIFTLKQLPFFMVIYAEFAVIFRMMMMNKTAILEVTVK